MDKFKGKIDWSRNKIKVFVPGLTHSQGKEKGIHGRFFSSI